MSSPTDTAPAGRSSTLGENVVVLPANFSSSIDVTLEIAEQMGNSIQLLDSRALVVQAVGSLMAGRIKTGTNVQMLRSRSGRDEVKIRHVAVRHLAQKCVEVGGRAAALPSQATGESTDGPWAEHPPLAWRAEVGSRRDRAADRGDDAAEVRERPAARRDESRTTCDQARTDRDRVEINRLGSVVDRAAAAFDRRLAAADRRREQMDELTSVYARRPGRRELELVIARGKQQRQPGMTVDMPRRCFHQVSAHLAETAHNGSITTGLAELMPDDNGHTLIGRADADRYRQRRVRVARLPIRP